MKSKKQKIKELLHAKREQTTHTDMKKLLLILLLLEPMLAQAYDVEIDGIYYNLDSETKTAEVTSSYSKYTGSVTIPSTVTYFGVKYSVTSIGNRAFWNFTENYTGLTSIAIPNSVTSIGNEAFYGCSGLTSITIPNSVTSIGNEAFKFCSGLTSITIPNSVTSIGYYVFEGCTGLTSITIPIPNIGSGAFWDCTGLTSINILNSVTSIGDRAFLGCTGLTSITIPSSVTSIGQSAFYKCTGLTSITIPNSVINIKLGAFSGCTSLTSVTIPESIINIEYMSFEGCCNIETVTCLAENVPSTGSDVFKDVNVEYATLVVPESALTAYSSTAPWSSFGTIKSLEGTSREKCATPEITYENGEIRAMSATEGAVCHISYASIPGASGANTLTPSIQLNVTAYATADGYLQSDEAKATFNLALPIAGDMNGDGKVTVEDVAKVVEKALGK